MLLLPEDDDDEDCAEALQDELERCYAVDVYVQEPSSSRNPDDFDGIVIEDVKEEDCECYFEDSGCDDNDLFNDKRDDCDRQPCFSWGWGRQSRVSVGSSSSSSSSSSTDRSSSSSSSSSSR